MPHRESECGAPPGWRARWRFVAAVRPTASRRARRRSVSYFSVKALREFVDARDPARPHDFFFARAGPGKRHVLPDRAVKQERFLQHNSQPRAVRIQPNRTQIHSIHANRSLGGNIKSGNQANGGRLPRTGRPTSAVTVPGSERNEILCRTSWLRHS